VNYLIQNKPFKEDSDTNMELFTETCIMMFVYTFFCFSDAIDDPGVRYNIGWAAIVIFMINVGGNLVVIVRATIGTMKESFYKNKNEMKRWCSTHCWYLYCNRLQTRVWWKAKGCFCMGEKAKKNKKVYDEE
jgi:hypothetical protein